MFAKIFILATIIALVNAHGYLREPIARTSIQLRPEFNTQQPFWWDHQGVWCGNVNQDVNFSTCGRCGDAPGQTTANQGGIFDKNVIVATYQAGSLVTFHTNFQAPHNGHFMLELCAQQTETDNCFVRLPIVSGTEAIRDGNRICVPYDNVNVNISAQVRLPAGVTCNRCTIRWTYRTSYPGRPNWDICDNPNPTQTFRNCADVRIQ